MMKEKSIFNFLAEVKSIKILLIDVDMVSQFIIAKCLKNFCDKLDICSSYENALKRVEVCDYDLILLVLNLPVVNGFELSNTLRQVSQFGGSLPKIIGLIGLDYPLLPTLISYSGVDYYTIRSIYYNDLKNKIVNLCYLYYNYIF